MTDVSSLDLQELEMGDVLILEGDSLDVTLCVMRAGRYPTCAIFDRANDDTPDGVCQILGTVLWDPDEADPLDIFRDGILLMDSGPIVRAVFSGANMADYFHTPNKFRVLRNGVVVESSS
jgi:hypothetical protein